MGLNTPEAKARIISWDRTTTAGQGRSPIQAARLVVFAPEILGRTDTIIHLDDGTMKSLRDEELPLLLPDLKKFQPSGTTESPLALATTGCGWSIRKPD